MPDQVDWRAVEREATPGRAVGRLLRDQREARGLDLSSVEKSLRIRRSHLDAIEDGRFDKLPGAAYIPAFLRAYSAHVGLDPEKVLTAYHLSGPVPIKRPVSLPADFPIVERRAPIGLAVLTVLLVVGAGYAVWNYLPREQAVIAEKVPPVPDRLLASRPAAPPAEATRTTTAAPVPPAQEARSTTGGLPAEVWPAPRHDTTAQPAPLAPPVVVAVPAPPPPVVMTIPSIGQAQAAQPPAQVEQMPRVAAPANAAPAAAAPTTITTEEAVARPPAVEAAPSLPMKIDTPVSVRVNSWVELRAPNGDVLAQTYVRAGESYVVPAGIAYRVIDAR
ncbi:MAG: helix-turn-helix domain-containing protein [Rhodospirillales bacterium]|nr:helix-turn-helix domain-containing protein [Rhodospirillales bacterium]